MWNFKSRCVTRVLIHKKGIREGEADRGISFLKTFAGHMEIKKILLFAKQNVL